VSTFLQELIHVGVYKRSQGRIARQATFAAVAIAIALGLLRLSSLMAGNGALLQFAIPGVLLAVGLWVAFRVVNVPGFADFLISVEAEMNKVSWPSRSELFRGSTVVLIMMFAFAGVLAACDLFWKVLLSWVLS
jgi:preprotein translocase subunit SecE